MSIAATAAQQSSTASTSSSAASASTSEDALSSLSSNFQDFLGMLMTQLKNQDPTSPMDTNQFTSELVEFSSVEQQINTNSALSQLITLTQSGQVLQSASIVGRTVQVSSDTMPLQNGSGTIDFTSSLSQPVNITIYDSGGNLVASASMTASQGSNSWVWDGTTSSGLTEPDGNYTVKVSTTGSNGTTSSLPFTVQGTVTGVQIDGTTLDLSIGTLSVPFSSIASVVN
jgi:flagellar basal-body rod modification protein FlgD